MTAKKPPTPPDEEKFEPSASETWWGSVTAFEEEAAAWLTPADKPQLKALYAIAHELDAGTFQAALISQFTLIHRALLARRPAGKEARPPSEQDTMFEIFGGWTAK